MQVGQARIDVDAAVGAQGQGVGRDPGERRGDRDVAGALTGPGDEGEVAVDQLVGDHRGIDPRHTRGDVPGGDHHIRRVEQERPGPAGPAAQIGPTAVIQHTGARHLRHAAIGAATGAERAAERRPLVRPNDDLAAAALAAIRHDPGAVVDPGLGGIRDRAAGGRFRRGCLAGGLAADLYITALRRAARVDPRGPGHGDDLAGDGDAAALAGRPAGADRAGHPGGAAGPHRDRSALLAIGDDRRVGLHIPAGDQQDPAFARHRAGRPQVAVAVAGQGIDIAAHRPQRDLGGLDPALVADIAGRAAHHDPRGIADRAQHEVLRRRKHRLAARLHGAAVRDLRAMQHHAAAGHDGATVDNGSRAGAAERQGARLHEAGRIGRPGAGDEAAAGDDLALRRDDDALRVDQVDAAGRRKRSRDRRRPVAGHAVERRAGAVVDLHALAGADGEAAPVDDAGPAGLGDRQRPGAGGDATAAGDELAALGQPGAALLGPARPGGGWHHQGGGDQQRAAEEGQLHHARLTAAWRNAPSAPWFGARTNCQPCSRRRATWRPIS